jgi:hypothetical protein
MVISEEQKIYMKEYYRKNKERLRKQNREKYHEENGSTKRLRVQTRIEKMNEYIKKRIEKYNLETFC